MSAYYFAYFQGYIVHAYAVMRCVSLSVETSLTHRPFPWSLTASSLCWLVARNQATDWLELREIEASTALIDCGGWKEGRKLRAAS